MPSADKNAGDVVICDPRNLPGGVGSSISTSLRRSVQAESMLHLQKCIRISTPILHGVRPRLGSNKSMCISNMCVQHTAGIKHTHNMSVYADVRKCAAACTLNGTVIVPPLGWKGG